MTHFKGNHSIEPVLSCGCFSNNPKNVRPITSSLNSQKCENLVDLKSGLMQKEKKVKAVLDLSDDSHKIGHLKKKLFAIFFSPLWLTF